MSVHDGGLRHQSSTPPALAQLEERETVDLEVAGSIPAGGNYVFLAEGFGTDPATPAGASSVITNPTASSATHSLIISILTTRPRVDHPNLLIGLRLARNRVAPLLLLTPPRT